MVSSPIIFEVYHCMCIIQEPNIQNTLVSRAHSNLQEICFHCHPQAISNQILCKADQTHLTQTTCDTDESNLVKNPDLE